MTRFDADTPDDRRKLFLEAIVAHRERASPFLTVEADPVAGGGDDRDATDSDPGLGDAIDAGDGDPPFAVEDPEGDPAEAGAAPGDEGPGDPVPPWVQFADGVVNLDCTAAELDRLKDLLEDYPAFRIDEITRPENAEGANVRVSARADANRIAGFVDDIFRSVYDLPDDYRAWVVEV